MIINNIRDYKLILASSSPRRQELLRAAGFDFEIRLKEVSEDYPADLSVQQVPEFLARLKASAFTKELQVNELLITADTIVSIYDKIIGKPNNRQEAIEILQELSGNCHIVITGVCATTTKKQMSFSACTRVYFRELTTDEIIYYVDGYKPFDKAGAYGIQEWIGYIGIERIEGSFYNVMGLPIQKLYDVLQKTEW